MRGRRYAFTDTKKSDGKRRNAKNLATPSGLAYQFDGTSTIGKRMTATSMKFAAKNVALLM